jgi:hypothetical protein
MVMERWVHTAMIMGKEKGIIIAWCLIIQTGICIARTELKESEFCIVMAMKIGVYKSGVMYMNVGLGLWLWREGHT